MRILVTVLWISLVSLLAYLPEQSEFQYIALGYIVLFGLYFFTYRYYRKHSDLLYFLLLSLVLRGLMLFAFPNLSDDIYRFVWDGHLLREGINPYLYTPNEWMAQSPSSFIFSEVFPKLNSPGYFSVYPPVSQVLFWLSTSVFGLSVYWASVLLKFVFLLAETGTIYILMKFVQQLGLPLKRVILYALNPLILIELVGNLHFEAVMIFFLISAFWFYARKRFVLFGFMFGLAILTKLLPLMFLPFFLKRTPFKHLVISFAVIGGVVLLGFLPFYSPELVQNFSSSLDLYFRKFEFNASFYYLARKIGYWWKGYNMISTIGPWLSLATLMFILGLAIREKDLSVKSLLKNCLLAFTGYLLLAMTIHPWYLAVPIVLCIFGHFRFPLFWSGLITLTYINYWGGDYHERMGIVMLEYGVVLFLLYLEAFRVPVIKSLTVRTLQFAKQWRRK